MLWAKRSPTSNHYLGLFVFTVVSVVQDGLCFTSKYPGSPPPLPDPCNPGLLAQPQHRSSASNKQPLINHALLITQALLSDHVCEIDLVCALLHWGLRVLACPSHLARHRCQSLGPSPCPSPHLVPVGTPLLVALVSTPLFHKSNFCVKYFQSITAISFGLF